jgi:deoxyuridine 5'-triphosphate nucleotidohydrolase
MKLNIKNLYNDNIIIPKYGSQYAAGLDICSNIDCTVLPNSRKLVSTGISISWDGEDAHKYYLRVAPRSGLSVKNNIDIGAGVIDYDYRGEIFICFINNNTEQYTIKKGDRIAQLILTKIEYFTEINEVQNHTETYRGTNGFGSTGK